VRLQELDHRFPDEIVVVHHENAVARHGSGSLGRTGGER
jgi:hypothetical protein